MKPNKITLVEWVDQALEQSFTKQNIKSWFRSPAICPLNPKAMYNKTRPLEIYTIVNMSNVGNEKNYILKEEAENDPQWVEESIIVELFHISKTYQHPRSKDLPIYRSQNDQHYYVNYMPHSSQ
jgi:hypothetical protein